MSLKSEMDDPMEKIVFIELYLDKQKFFGNVAEFLDGLLEGWVEWWNGKVLDRTETDLLSFSPTYLGETIEGYFTSRGLDIPPNDFKKILKDIGYYNFIRLRLTLVFNTINDKFIFKSPNHSEEVDWNRFKEVWSKPRNSLSYSNRNCMSFEEGVEYFKQSSITDVINLIINYDKSGMSSHHKDISYLIRTANKYYNINVDEPFTVDDVIDEVRSRGMSLDLFKKF